MRFSDGAILKHLNQTYDPVKAHEYYIRTRELKGRVGTSPPTLAPARKVGLSVTNSPTYAVKLGSGKTIKLSAKQLAEHQAYVAKRIIEIKQNLDKLLAKLSEMKRAAKKEETVSKRAAKEKPTSAERLKNARESKAYRAKHKVGLAAKSKSVRAQKSSKVKSVKDPVAELENKIAQIKGSLAAAVAQQRALTNASK